jgi:hypothetical protein
VRHLQKIREIEHLADILTNQIDWDGDIFHVRKALRKVKLI